MFSGSMVAIITPFTDEGTIDEKALANLVQWHIENQTDAIVCTGTTGEASTLSIEEKLLVLQICIEASQKKIPIIAGTGCNCTQKSVYLTQQAKNMGADGCLVVVPYYNKPTYEGIYQHYQEIAKANLPIILYHHPGRTGITLSPSFFTRVQEIENIKAIKEASCKLEMIDEINNHSTLDILSGDDALTVSIMEKKGRGVISVMANLLPKAWHQMTSFALEKNFAKAQEIYEKYKSLNEAIMKETNPQGIKFALSLLDKCLAKLRLPLVEPREENKKLIMQEMQKLDLI